MLPFVTNYYSDIDECQNSPCDHNCTNSVGSFMCSCPANYIIASDGLTCTGMTSFRLFFYYCDLEAAMLPDRCMENDFLVKIIQS